MGCGSSKSAGFAETTKKAAASVGTQIANLGEAAAAYNPFEAKGDPNSRQVQGLRLLPPAAGALPPLPPVLSLS